MSKEEQGIQAHPLGEVQIAGNQSTETVTSLDTFAGKIHVKWLPEATVSSLGLMPFFIEFLKTSGLFDKWVEDCPLHYTSAMRRRRGMSWERWCYRCSPVIGGTPTSTRSGATASIRSCWE